jgi:tetratricopeptide (TPR) repeat protein
MVQVNGLFQSWQSRQQTVAELVKAGQMQADAGDYAGAWRTYEQALQLEPGSRAPREGEVELAMVWLRNIRTVGKQTFSEIVDQILPALYRAVANRKGREAADALAHIGWANYLKNRDLGVSDTELWGPVVDEQFRRALRVDPGNVYAHAMWGFWILYRRGKLSDANQHFAEALKSGRQRPYVQELWMWALVDREDRDSVLELIRVADETRRNHGVIQAELRRRVFETVYPLNVSKELTERIVSVIPPTDHLRTFAWLEEGSGLDNDRRYRFYHARLAEAAGNLSDALSEYRALQSSSYLEAPVGEEVAHAIERIEHSNHQGRK